MNNVITLDCGEQLTISQLESWYVQCLKILVAGNSVFIDVSRLQRVDTAALQLLYQFHQQTQKYEIDLAWSPMSESFEDAVSLSGLHFDIREETLNVMRDSLENN